MDQEGSKHFLKGNPKVKYEYFFKASTLFGLEESYETQKIMLQETKNMVDSHKEHMPGLRAELEKAKEEYEEAKEMGNLEEEIKELNGQIIWCSVMDVETELEAAKGQMERAQSKVDGGIREKVEADQQRLKAVEAEKEPVEAESLRIKRQLDVKSAAKAKLQDAARKLHKQAHAKFIRCA